jgi:UDP-3-O-[3-hydroxymyristoyl] glucosamine N-acyltransferase
MQEIKLSEIAALVGGELEGDRDPVITGVAGVEEAGTGDLTFLARPGLVATLEKSGAAGVLVGPGLEVSVPAVRVEDPYRAFAAFLARLQTPLDRLFPPGVHPTAVVDPTARVADTAAIGPYSVVGAGSVIGPGTRLAALVVIGCDVTVGADCRFHAQVSIREGSVIGDRVIGSDGFGYLTSPQGIQQIPQVGIVEIGDDVELGANVCVDRATVGRTVVGAGSKIDNQVQIGHNVRVGRDTILCAQVGIAGSCVLGDRVVAGGQVGIADHVTLGNDVRIGAQSGIMKDAADGQTVFGSPATDIRESMRITAAMRRLPDLMKRVAQLEKSLGSGDHPPDADQE